MTIFSTLSRFRRVPIPLKPNNICQTLLSKKKNALVLALRYMSDDRKMFITPTRYPYTKFKDDLHFYITIGVVPITIFIVLINIFIGPATLTEIPEDYEPKHWEYYRHPISRFFMRYCNDDQQIWYEKTMHGLVEEKERNEWIEDMHKAKELMAERDDYKAWFYRESDQGREIRFARKENDELAAQRGYR